jgi:hypothetical protein
MYKGIRILVVCPGLEASGRVLVCPFVAEEGTFKTGNSQILADLCLITAAPIIATKATLSVNLIVI